MERGGPHFGSKGKHPAARIATIAAAGELAIPFTTGILVGIGETRRERIESLLVIRALHERYFGRALEAAKAVDDPASRAAVTADGLGSL